MRLILQDTSKIARALVLVAAASLILAAPARAQGRRRAARQHSGVRAPVGHQFQAPRHYQTGVVMPDYGWSWWNYPYDGVAYTPYGMIQYTQYGYGWGLPYYFVPFSDGFSESW